jgi:hypothetical protein
MACTFVFDGLASTNAQCYVGISKHILDQGHRYIFFGHKDMVYVINKQLIVDVFGVCVEGYVEDLKG